MSGKIRLLLSLLSLAAALFIYTAMAQENTPRWQVIPEKSFIKFTATYANAPLHGEFKRFEADIRFSPQHLKESSVVVRVDIASVTADDTTAQKDLPTSLWFDAEKYKEAVFEAKEFVHIKDNNYEARGMLMLREHQAPMTLNFKLLQFDKTAAKIEGSTTISRLAFGVGQGEWVKTDTVGDKVIISVAVEAKPL